MKMRLMSFVLMAPVLAASSWWRDIVLALRGMSDGN